MTELDAPQPAQLARQPAVTRQQRATSDCMPMDAAPAVLDPVAQLQDLLNLAEVLDEIQIPQATPRGFHLPAANNTG